MYFNWEFSANTGILSNRAKLRKPMNILKKVNLSILTLVITIAVMHFDSFNYSLEAAEVYTWVDNKGVKHYSDKPFKAAKKVSFSVATPQKQVKETVIQEPELFDINDEARLSAECASAKKNVANLLKGGKILQKNAEGKDVELSLDQVNAKLSESQEYIKRYCSKAVTKSDVS